MTLYEIEEILKDNFKKFGWSTWQNKESVLFNMKAKYGDSFDLKIANKVFDEIYNREVNKIKGEVE